MVIEGEKGISQKSILSSLALKKYKICALLSRNRKNKQFFYVYYSMETKKLENFDVHPRADFVYFTALIAFPSKIRIFILNLGDLLALLAIF